MAHSGYQQSLDFLFARTTGAFKFGLDRTQALLAELGDPHLAVPCIHVGGTNGKGSTVATCAALLKGQGLRVGVYTSPHLVDFRERIVVDGEPIPPDAVVEFIDRYTPTIERLGASFFEATTAMAFDWIARVGADVSIIEVGLGGRLDSTNVVDPVVAGVVSIGRDHTEYLGDTLEAIAFEKAGIFKPDRPAVIGESNVGLSALLASHGREHRASPIRVLDEEMSIADVQVTLDGTRFSVVRHGQRDELFTPLVGRHQARNAAFAWLLLESAGDGFAVPLGEAREALGEVRLPGRFERIGEFIFDVAHNPDGAMVLAETLATVQPPRPVVALFSVLGDKDWRAMMRTLAPVVDSFIATVAPTSPESRTWTLSEVADFAVREGIALRAEMDFEAALRMAQEAGATVVVTGSFHTVGDAMSRLQLSPLAR